MKYICSNASTSNVVFIEMAVMVGCHVMVVVTFSEYLLMGCEGREAYFNVFFLVK